MLDSYEGAHITHSVFQLAMGWTVGGPEFDFWQGQDFSPLHVVPTRNGGSSLGVKRPEREADHSRPTSAELKNTWIYIATSPYAFMAQGLNSQAQGQLYFFV
jgi:hypothetical protein